MIDVAPRDLLAFATDVAQRAGLATLAHFQTDLSVEAKSDDSPVTVADREAETILRTLIEARFPADAIVGEEFGETRNGAQRRWIIDPIDGTRSFIRGVPLFGVMIGVEEAGEMIAGVLHFPALQETVSAAAGEGCWWNGRRARVSECDRIDTALILTTDVENVTRENRDAAYDRLRARSGMVRTWGDCYGYALVATGRAEAMMDPVVSIWDAAALAPIITEAGGVFTDWDGNPTWRNRSILATNAALASEIRLLLGTS